MERESLISSVQSDDDEDSSIIPTKMKKSYTKLWIIAGVGIIAIIAGVTAGYFWSSIFQTILTGKIILSPTSESYPMWQKTPIPMHLKIYLFNWSNPDELLNKQTKPHFTEHGPYVFREVDYKLNKVWNDNGTVTFQQKRVWNFLPSLSNGSLDDKITNLNPVTTSVAYRIRNDNRFAKIAINSLLKVLNEKIAMTKTVRELLFDGYDDSVLELAYKLNISIGIPSKKFGWFYGRNNSEKYDGTFNILTGSSDKHQLGLVNEWNFSNVSKIFPGECKFLNGTLGDLWPPLDETNKTVNVFAPDICTLINLEYDNDEEFQGLVGKKFISTSKTFDNGTKVPSRSCYCENTECQPSGVLNVSPCKFGAPAFISLPHFYLADKTYVEAVDGLKPNKEDHEFSVLVEPHVGIPLQVNARLQLNLLIQPIDRLKIFENVPRVYVPILWFKQEANLTSSYGDKIKFVLTLPLLGYVTFYGIAAIGILLLFIDLGILIRGWRKEEENQQLISNTESSTTIRNDG